MRGCNRAGICGQVSILCTKILTRSQSTLENGKSLRYISFYLTQHCLYWMLLYAKCSMPFVLFSSINGAYLSAGKPTIFLSHLPYSHTHKSWPRACRANRKWKQLASTNFRWDQRGRSVHAEEGFSQAPVPACGPGFGASWSNTKEHLWVSCIWFANMTQIQRTHLPLVH